MDFYLIEESDYGVLLMTELDLRHQSRHSGFSLAMIPFCHIFLKFAFLSSLFSLKNNINIILVLRCHWGLG